MGDEMTDLIKELRGLSAGPSGEMERIGNKAADRIELLVKERDDYAHKLMEANNTYTQMHLEIERLSDKLAKAVEALQKIADEYDKKWWAGRWSRATLAELEEQK